MMVSKTNAAYIAGIADGEGYIGISKQHDGQGFRGFRYRGRIQIEMTDRHLLRWIQKTLDLGVLKKRPIRNIKWKQEYALVISEKAIIPALKIILPFLRLKRKQAEILLRFRLKTHRPGVKGHTLRTRKFQDSSYHRIRELNRRGPQ